MLPVARKKRMPAQSQGGRPAAGAPGQILARPAAQQQGEAASGLLALAVAEPRDALLYIPATYRADQPRPLVVLLHGAGGEAQHGMALLRPLADAKQLILLAPSARRDTWDVIHGGYGPDVALIDRALGKIFSHYAIDAARVAIGGFSDGASYALSLGLTNGGLFTHVVAFSPGFMAPAHAQGKPRIFISHGTRDTVLPIDRCSRRLVARLERAEYDLFYHEFDGPHTVPPEIAAEAVGWFLAGD